MRTFHLPSGRTIELDDRDFRSIVCSNRESVMRMLGVRRGPLGIAIERTVDEDGEVRHTARLRDQTESAD